MDAIQINNTDNTDTTQRNNTEHINAETEY